jgi:hypothetical protein
MLDSILLLAGASLIKRDPKVINSYLQESSTMNMTINLIVFSLFEYSEGVANKNQISSLKSTGESNKKTKKESIYLEKNEILMLQKIRNIGSNCSTTAPSIASTEWVFHCIQAGAIVDLKKLDIFSLPSDPVLHPFGYKDIFANGERYSKYDIVYYSRSSSQSPKSKSEDRLVAKIIDFSRRSVDCPFYVRIHPFHRKGQGSSKARTSNRVMDGADIKDAELELATISTSALASVCGSKELFLSDESEITIIDSKSLLGKAVVLSKSTFINAAAYSTRDEDIFYVSDDDFSDSDGDSSPSQDY